MVLDLTLTSSSFIGFAGLILVFISFTVRKFHWIYGVNIIGTGLLEIYSIILGNFVFIAAEGMILVVLSYRFAREVKMQKIPSP